MTQAPARTDNACAVDDHRIIVDIGAELDSSSRLRTRRVQSLNKQMMLICGAFGEPVCR